MCARYEHTIHDLSRVAEELEAALAVEGERLVPRWNIAPTSGAAIVRRREHGIREVVAARWGLIPSWSKDAKIAGRTINARAETVASKPAFRAAFKARRCLVPATGWYEWVGPPKARTPVRIRRADRGLLTFAGLWEFWRAPGGGAVESFTICTTDAAPSLRSIHDRMPVVLSGAARAAWLHPETPRDDLTALLRPCDEGLEAVGADPRLNRSGVDGEELGADLPLSLPPA